eukprot:9500650-Pyramimonas_sp.AAC.1
MGARRCSQPSSVSVLSSTSHAPVLCADSSASSTSAEAPCPRLTKCAGRGGSAARAACSRQLAASSPCETCTTTGRETPARSAASITRSDCGFSEYCPRYLATSHSAASTNREGWSTRSRTTRWKSVRRPGQPGGSASTGLGAARHAHHASTCWAWRGDQSTERK